MKTLTTRDFFHSPGLTKSLRPGQALVVTDNGKPAFTVLKAGQRKTKSAADLAREAREICERGRPPVNLSLEIRKLKK